MAYTNFNEIDDRSFEKLLENGFQVIEKLDMIYFRVRVNGSDDISVLKSPKFREINEYDIVMNTVYGKMTEFAESHIRPMSEWIYRTAGACTIGFFYLPVPKTRIIDYGGFPKKFIINDIYTDDPSMKDKFGMYDICVRDSDISIPPVMASYNGGCSDKIADAMRVLREDADPSLINDALNTICNGRSFTGISLEKMEGVIISSGKYRYRISINDTATSCDPYLKALYRDRVMLNVIHTISDGNGLLPSFESVLSSEKTAIHRICDMFVEYMSSTDLLKMDLIDEDDVTPPCDGYMGDIDVSMITPTARIISRNNPLYKNILRMMINEFRPDVPHDNISRRSYSDADKACLKMAVELLSR